MTLDFGNVLHFSTEQPMFRAMTKGHTDSNNRKDYKIFWYLIGVQFNSVGMLECY